MKSSAIAQWAAVKINLQVHRGNLRLSSSFDCQRKHLICHPSGQISSIQGKSDRCFDWQVHRILLQSNARQPQSLIQGKFWLVLAESAVFSLWRTASFCKAAWCLAKGTDIDYPICLGEMSHLCEISVAPQKGLGDAVRFLDLQCQLSWFTAQTSSPLFSMMGTHHFA